MGMRERHYDDPELARRLEDWLVNHFERIDINSVRQGSTVFFTNTGIEYAGVFCQESGKRMFCFHVENPSNDLVSDMCEGLVRDSMFNTDRVLSRPKYKGRLNDYRKVFRREYVKKGEIYVQNRNRMSAVSAVSIKQLPLGAERRLSGNFLEMAFDYNIRPVIILAQKHKLASR